MNRLSLLANAAVRSLSHMFPGYYPGAKHNHYKDFGYPQTVTFNLAFDMYTRNGVARAGVDKTVSKTWESLPYLQEFARDGARKSEAETKLEADIRQRFADLRLWQRLAECDRRGMVGAYSGLVLRLADNKRLSEAVDTVPGGLRGLVEVIPAWEGQLEVSEWDTNELSPTYGQPTMFRFNEAAVETGKKQPRQVAIHPDRVLIWSRDGTLDGRSTLEPGYNDLLSLEKVVGAGGEGFWKNAKAAPILEVDATANLESMAKAMGVSVEELADKMDEQVGDWQRGFDQLLMLQGMKANGLQINLPSPEHFVAAPLQGFAASMSIPIKILVGSQTGERASTEDAGEWARTNMSRRTNEAVPGIMGLVQRLERFRIFPEKDWHLAWTDLTESSLGEKIERANKMADVNQKMKDSGEIVFTHEEIRAAVDLEPLSDAEKRFDEVTEDEERAALGGAPDTPPATASQE